MNHWNKAAVIALLGTEHAFCWIATRELATIEPMALA